MSFTAFAALVRRDLRLFFLDKRAMTMSFLAPILIGSFFGYLFGGVTKDRTPSKIAVAVDRSGWQRDFEARRGGAERGSVARGERRGRWRRRAASVRAGKTTVGAVIPAGFGEPRGAGLLPRRRTVPRSSCSTTRRTRRSWRWSAAS